MVAVPFPPAYGTRRWAAPESIDRTGTPTTATGSLNDTVMLITSPAVYAPLALADETASTRGAMVSIRMFDELESERFVPGSGSVGSIVLPTASAMRPP